MTAATIRPNRFFAFLVLIGLAVVLSGCGINAIPTREEQARAAWSQVLNQYQRRADLIPNLVATVQGFAAQEREVLEGVVEARSRATQFQLPEDILTNEEAFRRFEETQNTLGGALGRLIAIQENYPDLKSSQNFLTLQAQLEGTENRIAVARRDYIEAVRLYNTELKTIPGVFWARVLYPDREPMQTFTIDPANEAAPTVSFD